MKFGQGPEDDEEAPPAPAFVGFLAVDDVNYGLFANFSASSFSFVIIETFLTLGIKKVERISCPFTSTPTLC